MPNADYLSDPGINKDPAPWLDRWQKVRFGRYEIPM